MHILEFLSAHKDTIVTLAFPVLSAIVTWLFKPRTPEEYSLLSPRVAAVFKFIGALGIDAPKLIESIQQIVTGKYREKNNQLNGVSK